MKSKAIGLALCIMILPCLAWPITRTVAKSGTPDFATIQAAIASLTPDPDPGVPDTIQIQDAVVYDEVITINVPVTIQGNTPNRPVICTQLNTGSAGDGIFISIATGTANDVTLRNLIIIPSRTTIVTDDLIMSNGQNLNILLDNVLITANNGSDAPVSTDGLSEVSLVAPVQRTGDDGIYLGSGAAPAGDGTTVTLRNTVITHVVAATPAGNDGMVCAGACKAYIIEDGCVFSYCARLGMQANGLTFRVNAPTKRALVLGNKGFAGIWFAGATNGVERTLRGINVLNNGASAASGWGIEQNNHNTNGILIEDAIIAGNKSAGIVINNTGFFGPTNCNRVTFADNGTSHIRVLSPYSGAINLTDCILGGNGGSDAQVNVNVHEGSGVMTLNGCGVVLSPSSPQRLTGTGFTGAGIVTTVKAIYEAPAFVQTTNFSSSSFFDVQNNNFATANAANGPLGAGADFVGGVSSVQDYSLY